MPDAGSFNLRNSATAAWAKLKIRSSGRTYVFVSAHLSSGKSSGADTRRDDATPIASDHNLVRATIWLP